MAATAWVIASFSACRVIGHVCALAPLNVPKEKNFKVINQVTSLGGEAMSPFQSESAPKQLSEAQQHRGVFFSTCRNQSSASWSPRNWFNFGQRKVSIM
ncbi:hypothetical protein TNIN_409511 [Trichonephila inaurata madagascariensis]|uniref:Secreted protein n=1 Tax=Trichonephila inaurata madagascariensis TaxID=2747483 RepID=A0A8X7CF17_9ARAC|nr:hypothetical protein TNIN_409511 [Trichonephila inaurata madagascariensis]